MIGQIQETWNQVWCSTRFNTQSIVVSYTYIQMIYILYVTKVFQYYLQMIQISSWVKENWMIAQLLNDESTEIALWLTKIITEY